MIFCTSLMPLIARDHPHRHTRFGRSISHQNRNIFQFGKSLENQHLKGKNRQTVIKYENEIRCQRTFFFWSFIPCINAEDKFNVLFPCFCRCSFQNFSDDRIFINRMRKKMFAICLKYYLKAFDYANDSL